MREEVREGRAVLGTGKTPAEWVDTREMASTIHIAIGSFNAKLTPEEARRLARHLHTLATRVEKRTEAQP